MSDLTRTPGPWSVNDSSHYEGGKPCCVWGPKGAGYGIVCELPAVYPREFNAQDAALIAAAPDMAALLAESLLPVLRLQPPPKLGGWNWPQMAADIEAVLRKAGIDPSKE